MIITRDIITKCACGYVLEEGLALADIVYGPGEFTDTLQGALTKLETYQDQLPQEHYTTFVEFFNKLPQKSQFIRSQPNFNLGYFRVNEQGEYTTIEQAQAARQQLVEQLAQTDPRFQPFLPNPDLGYGQNVHYHLQDSLPAQYLQNPLNNQYLGPYFDLNEIELAKINLARQYADSMKLFRIQQALHLDADIALYDYVDTL